MGPSGVVEAVAVNAAAALVVAAAALSEARENWEEAAEVLEG